MKVYVTGHNGFLGRHLVRKLQNQDYDVLVSGRGLDLRNQLQVDNFFKKHRPDWVFGCAAMVGGMGANLNDPYKFLFDNLQIQNNVIDYCLRYEVKKVLNLGSSCIYPKNYRQPLVEEDLLAAPVEPTNEGYSLAKIAGLKLCEYANRTQDLTKFVSLMPSNLYGPGDNFDSESSHVLAALVKKIVDAVDSGIDTVTIWGTGGPQREWLYVEDLAEAMIWAMENIEKTEKFLNVGVGKDISILELASIISDKVGYQGRFDFDQSKPDGMMKKRLDVSKINTLGWTYKTSLDVGLNKTIEYYRELKNGIADC